MKLQRKPALKNLPSADDRIPFRQPASIPNRRTRTVYRQTAKMPGAYKELEKK
jgi:hypothetical protein